MNKKMSNSYTDEGNSFETIISYLKELWINKTIVIKATVLFFLFGCIYGMISPLVYTSHTTFVPQVSENDLAIGSNSSLGSLASMAGINLYPDVSGDNYLSPLLYKKIVKSEEFSLELIKEEIIDEDKNKISIEEYMKNSSGKLFNFDPVGFIKKYTIGLFQKVKANDPIQNNEIGKEYTFINGKDYNNIRAFRNKFKVELNQVDGYINVLAYDKDPFVSAQLVKIITKNLQSKIIEIRTNKIRERLEYSKEQYELKQSEFDVLQKKVAEFRDSNKNISTASFMSKLQKLESEYSLQQSILVNLAGEYNRNKIQLNKDTPIFSVIDEVTVPYERSAPKRTNIALGFMISGLVISSLYVLTKDSSKEIIKKFKD